MRLNPVLLCEDGHILDSLQFAFGSCVISIKMRVGILTGVEFYHGCPQPQCSFDLALVRFDK